MLFTPFHFGVGALAKSVAPKHFSFQVFVLSQVLIDFAPDLGRALGWDELHGLTQTWVGAVLIALVTFAVWRAWERHRPQRFAMDRLGAVVVLFAALFGTLMHVWLDAAYSAEITRMTPERLRASPGTAIEDLCVVAGMLGLAIYTIRSFAHWLFQRYRGVRTDR